MMTTVNATADRPSGGLVHFSAKSHCVGDQSAGRKHGPVPFRCTDGRRALGYRDRGRGGTRHDALVRPPRAAFTLVEMLVVIVIIGILASLITVAATAALDKAHETRIKVELDQISMAFQQYKNQCGAHPPNFVWQHLSQRDNSDNHIRRHMRKAFPRISQFDLNVLELFIPKDPDPAARLNPAQAVVFWLGGFSTDPEHPLTGPGGPAYDTTAPENQDRRYDLSGRNKLFEFDEARLGPRDEDGVFTGDSITFDNAGTLFEIPLLVYRPPQLQQPFVYFDTARFTYPLQTIRAPGQQNWPSYDDLVRAYIKGDDPNYNPGDPASPPPEFVNPNSFQVIAAGTDDEWGHLLGTHEVLYPQGPYVDQTGAGGFDYSGHADNLVNFSPRNLEDSQP